MIYTMEKASGNRGDSIKICSSVCVAKCPYLERQQICNQTKYFQIANSENYYIKTFVALNCLLQTTFFGNSRKR